MLLPLLSLLYTHDVLAMLRYSWGAPAFKMTNYSYSYELIKGQMPGKKNWEIKYVNSNRYCIEEDTDKNEFNKLIGRLDLS